MGARQTQFITQKVDQRGPGLDTAVLQHAIHPNPDVMLNCHFFTLMSGHAAFKDACCAD
jgi:hypothetical protein